MGTGVNTDYYFHSLKGVFDKFGEVCTWFEELGFSYARTRYGLYEKTFLAFEDSARGDSKKTVTLDQKRKFDNAYLEANEIIRVQADLSTINSDQFIEQLKFVLSGQEFRNQTSNDAARDFLFEISIASRFIRAGYSVSLNGICDVVVTMGDGYVLFIECKRIKSEKRIRDNVKKANKQIVSRIQNYALPKAKGLVAINITDLIPETNNLLPDSPVAGTIIHKLLMNKFLDAHTSSIFDGKSKHCVGVLCESSRVHYFSKNSPQQGLQYSRHTSFAPYDAPGSLSYNMIESIAPKICNQNINR
ncbi:hypothetical protein [Trichlorobacter lovleyi]|uniref:hypothetical protein n=1 Tax=Trichlorobacter lovleyi TaxID=313985 RepID=UPI0024808CE3|nr:hypothetical protein [Trichlorobacter lovleyi]